MAKYRYALQHQFQGEWIDRYGFADEKLEFLRGFVFGLRDGPHELVNPHRIRRSDGRIMDVFEGRTDPGIGMIAGWPTPEQYEGAAQRCLERAAKIRKMQTRA